MKCVTLKDTIGCMNLATKTSSLTEKSDTISENESSFYTFTNKSNQEKLNSNKMYKFRKLVNKWSNISIKEDRIKPFERKDFEVN